MAAQQELSSYSEGIKILACPFPHSIRDFNSFMEKTNKNKPQNAAPRTSASPRKERPPRLERNSRIGRGKASCDGARFFFFFFLKGLAYFKLK